ncbi:MAG: hypothetical protein ACE5LQ_05640 [Candidatus Bipolaricaulia bacterium]
MRTLLIVAVLLVLLGATCSVGLAQLGVGVKVPLAVFAQLRLSPSFALEAGLPLGVIGVGLAVNATAKLYLSEINLAGLLSRPFAGAGLSLFFGRAIVTGVHALVGLEFIIPQTPLRVFGELGLSYVSFLGFGGLGIGGDLGVRFDF